MCRPGPRSCRVITGIMSIGIQQMSVDNVGHGLVVNLCRIVASHHRRLGNVQTIVHAQADK